MIDDVSAVLSGVRNDIAKPDGEHENCDDPHRVEGESDQATQQGYGKHRHHCGAGYPRSESREEIRRASGDLADITKLSVPSPQLLVRFIGHS